ncbi:MAG TPA: SDR family NAD(P)-dependent oxidoreductase [Jatrophihabitans sp.]|jgi:NADP-dependent 3-hydroxy acid dehydrogenase YdfG|nr:SDR family NAD(P)-dependent oxidoreductase [Jatrophihabitans sp.]
MDLRGSVALVTGAAGPIGAAVSTRLASLGASVAVLDRRPAAVAHQITGSGGHVLALTGDPDDPTAVRAAVGRLLTAWERIDIVVIPSPGTGIAGVGSVAQAVAGFLPEAARTGSRGVADLVVIDGAGAPDRFQVAAEQSVEAFCDSLRQELAGQPVRVELVRSAAVRNDPAGDGTQHVTEEVVRLIGRPAAAVLAARAAG